MVPRRKKMCHFLNVEVHKWNRRLWAPPAPAQHLTSVMDYYLWFAMSITKYVYKTQEPFMNLTPGLLHSPPPPTPTRKLQTSLHYKDEPRLELHLQQDDDGYGSAITKHQRETVVLPPYLEMWTIKIDHRPLREAIKEQEADFPVENKSVWCEYLGKMILTLWPQCVHWIEEIAHRKPNTLTIVQLFLCDKCKKVLEIPSAINCVL